MSLDQELKARHAEIHSDGYPMSIGELINLCRDDELDLHPEFQRFYRMEYRAEVATHRVYVFGHTNPLNLCLPKGGRCLGRD